MLRPNRWGWLAVVGALGLHNAKAAGLYCVSEAWSSHTTVRNPTTLSVDGHTLWMGSLFGGVLEWDTVAGHGRIYTRTGHCLPDNEVRDLSVASTGGLAGEVWVTTIFGVGRRPHDADPAGTWDLFNSANSGLADPITDAVAVTAGGQAWIGSFESGAFRYDGEAWVHFGPGNSGLANPTVTSIQTDLESVWFGTWGGAFRLESGTFTRFTPTGTGTPPGFCQGASPLPPDQLGLTSGVVEVLDVDTQTGVVWLAGLDDGPCFNTTTSRFDGQRWMSFSPFNSDIISAAMTGATAAPDGREVIVSPFGSQFYDPVDASFTDITFPDGTPLGATDVARQGEELWFASAEHGLVRLGNGQLTVFHPPGLNDNLVQDLLLIEPASPGAEPIAWVGNRRGAQQLVDGEWRSFDPGNTPLAGFDVRAVVRGLDGAIWFGTATNGISRFDGQTWTTFNSANSGLRSNNIGGLAVDPATGAIWAGYQHESGSARFLGNTWVPHAAGPPFGTRALIVEGASNVWFAGANEVIRYNGVTSQVVNAGLPSNSVAALALGPDNRLYVGTAEGAAVLDLGNTASGWQPLPVVHPFLRDIQALDVDAGGHLWAGVRDLGLAELADDTWTIHTTTDGLTNNRVRVIRIAADDTVWAGTEEGLSLFRQDLADDETQDINYGHSGGWFEPATSGQGFLIDIIPDDDYLFAAWFTFDTDSPQTGGQIPGAEHRWFTAEGHYTGHRAELIVYQTRGGAFDQPAEVTTTPVGSMVMEFSSCTQGTVSYDLPGFSLSGEISIVRLLADEICSRIGNGEIDLNSGARVPRGMPKGQTQDINYGLIGGWFEPATSGQGFLLDLLTAEDYLFVAWFTFDASAARKASGGPISGAELRWLTAEGPFVGHRAELTVFQTRNGVFDDPAPVSTEPVGSMTIEFQSCTQGIIDYNLPDFALSGQIPITKLLNDEICTAINEGEIRSP